MKGGAIYAKQSNITVLNSVLSGNRAVVGAGVYFDCSFQNQCAAVLSNNIFRDNIASVKGGGVYYNLHRPLFSSNQFVNNSAEYGPNIASYAVKIVKAETATNKVFLDTIASGIKYNNTLKFNLVDYDGQVMVLEDEHTIKITPVTNGVSITGSDVAKIKNGTASFSDLTFVAQAGMKDVEYVLTSKVMSYSILMRILKRLTNEFQNTLIVSFRYCQPGEIETESKQCVKCSYGTYSFDWNSTECKQCMDNARCEGGTEIQVNKGYWRLSTNSTTIVE